MLHDQLVFLSASCVSHSFIVALPDISQTICSLAPSRLNSATSLSSEICTLRIKIALLITDDPYSIYITLTPITMLGVLTRSLSLSLTGTHLKSVHWHHPPSARQCFIATGSDVHSELPSSPWTKFITFDDPASIESPLNRCLFYFVHCRSCRELTSNQLNGTIPPQLGDFMRLTYLDVQNYHEIFFDH